MSPDEQSPGRAWWATVPATFRVALCVWGVSFGLFLFVTVAEVSAVNVWAAVFGAATGGLGALLLADIGGAATSMARRPGMASRWALEVRRARSPMLYRLVGAAYVVVGVLMLVVGASGKIHVGRY